MVLYVYGGISNDLLSWGDCMMPAESVAKASVFATYVLSHMYISHTKLFANYAFGVSFEYALATIKSLTIMEKIHVLMAIKDKVSIYQLLYSRSLRDVECIGCLAVNELEEEIVKDFWALPRAYDSLDVELDVEVALKRFLENLPDYAIELIVQSISEHSPFDEYTTPACKLLTREHLRRANASLALHFVPKQSQSPVA